ncbi:hypothetical protein A3A38_03750 [Candidatus Kaiserbacteria bacterium RIFCSPLOWO2_01_FULL_53_17]|uniref:Uncharacterized protein n=1 Tax=Candidatus Kaiserbacteria bacterium RIFCSPLOWO2_01_FULL_53_17 TaxID=1798511 RepID=A0A1F6EGI8_9BACT|nr:MAG: hypothetical protein A3A38_03750 [Candidatus Kaiserbacteria bacterium RIFCSPLOWO2_01_FULL_53_17]
MNLRAYTPLILGIIVIVAVLGMPLMLASPVHQEMGCPFAMGQTTICSMSIFEHVAHWRIAFAAIFAELLVVAALALIAVRQWELVALPEPGFVRIRLRSRAPARPTLFQELFSRGIVHPKVF